MHQLVPISKLKANPFRHLEDYPIDQDKIAELERSFEQTGFWDNILARENGSGYEIAYGHHRLTALRKKFGERKKVGIIVRPLSDEDMLRIMAAENAEEYRTLAVVEHETIRAVVEAFAEGKISLATPSAKTTPDDIYVAPSFVEHPADDASLVGLAYTRSGVARFLGWTKKQTGGTERPDRRCEEAFRALEMMERGLLKKTDFKGLTRRQAEELTTRAVNAFQAHNKQAKRISQEAKKVAKEGDTRKAERLERQAEESRKAATRDARNVATTLQKGFTKKDDAIGVRDADKEARRVSTPLIAPKEVVPNVEQIAERLADRVMKFLSEGKEADEIKLLIKFRNELSARDRKQVASQLNKLKIRCENFYTALMEND